METYKKTYPNGRTVNYKMTREKGFFTSHIWIYQDGKPLYHITPTDQNTCRVLKYVDGYGYMSMGEQMTDFDKANITHFIN